MIRSPTVRIANATVLISLVLVLSLAQAVTVRAAQPVSTDVKWLDDKHTLAQVTVTFSDGTKTVYTFQTAPSGPQSSGGLSILSLKSGTLAVGDSYGRQVSVTKLSYPASVSIILRSASAIQIHLSATALAVINVVIILAMVAVIVDYFGSYTVLKFLLAALVNILTFVLTDRNSNWSLDLWAPVDWYNTGLALIFKYIFVGTPHYWWKVFGSAVPPIKVANR